MKSEGALLKKVNLLLKSFNTSGLKDNSNSSFELRIKSNERSFTNGIISTI